MRLARFLKNKREGASSQHPGPQHNAAGPSRQQDPQQQRTKRKREGPSGGDDDEADSGTEGGPSGVVSVEPGAFNTLMQSLQKNRKHRRKSNKRDGDDTTPGPAGNHQIGSEEHDSENSQRLRSVQGTGTVDGVVKQQEDNAVGHDAVSGDPEETEGDMENVEEFFKVQLTDIDAAGLVQGKPKFQKSEHPDYQSVWPHSEFECSGASLPNLKARLKAHGVCHRVQKAWRKAGIGNTEGDFVSAQQKALFGVLSKYLDVFIPDVPYPSSYKDESPIMDACVAHCVNHIFRSIENSKRIQAKISEAQTVDGMELADDEIRDRGFTRPKVLFLVPMKSVAFRIMEKIFKFGEHEKEKRQLENYEKLLDEYGPDEKLEAVLTDERKPADYKGIFGGNVEDAFKIGIQFSRKGIQCYANFYRSDIVIASPLSLSMMGSKGDLDFLSSIEIAVIDRADVATMQNWQHVVSVVRQINLIPKAQHDVNVMRVRELYLKSHGRHYRQTILLSSFATAEMNALFNGSACTNHRGKVRLKKVHRGVLEKIAVPALDRQIFEKYAVKVVADAADARLKFFEDVIVPKVRSMGGGVLVFVPHYFDFVRLRVLVQKEGVDFCWITEYSEEKHSRKCKAEFARGDVRVMLITERAFFYARPKLHGIKDIIFYGLPEHAHYYPEIVNMLEEPMTGVHPTVVSLFSKFTALQLERIVGSTKAKKMIKGQSSSYILR